MGDKAPALYTVEEAAKLIRVGRTKAYAMTQEWRATGGRSGLPVVDFGNVLRVPRAALEQLLGVDLAGTSVAATPAPAPDAVAEAEAEAVTPLRTPPVEEVSVGTAAAGAPATKRPPRGGPSRRVSDQLDLFDAAS